jgi:TPR repeat protein
VWPQALALLLACWLMISSGPHSPGNWAKPADCTAPSSPGCAATRHALLVFPNELVNPTIAGQSTIVVDRTSFRGSSAGDQPRLVAALGVYYRKEWQRAISVLQAARTDDPNVQFMLALALLGESTVDSSRRAQTLLQAASAAGHRQSGAMLGRILMGWPGVIKDELQGRRLIENAAAGGDAYAMRLAAIGYLGREFGTYDPARAVDLMRRAADAGDPGAMLQFARFLSTGFGGVEQSETRSLDYVRRAAEAGFTGAQTLVADWLVERYRNQETDDLSEAIGWYERAYQRGYSMQALVNLAFAYRVAARAPPWLDTSRSFALLQLCAPYADASCQFWLGSAYQAGAGTAHDIMKAYAHVSVAKQLGRRDAVSYLQQIEAALLPAAKPAAAALAEEVSASLKPVPPLISLQTAEAEAGPSPWTLPQPAQPRVSSTAAADWAACRGANSDLAMTACTHLIESGLNGSDLGVARYFKAWNHYLKKQFQQAIEDYGEGIRIGAMLPAAYAGRGMAFQEIDNTDAALRDFDASIRADPSFAFGYATRGELYRRLKQPDNAIADATKAIQLNSKLAFAYGVRAGGYEQKGMWAQVAADCTTAIDLDSKYQFCIERRDLARAKMGQK